MAKTPQSIPKEALTKTTKVEASASDDADNPSTPHTEPSKGQKTAKPADGSTAPTSPSEEFPYPQSIVIDSRNSMVDGYEMLAQKRAQDQGMIKAAEVRAVEEQTRMDTQHSKVKAAQQARQLTLGHEQPRKVTENAASNVTQEQVSTSVKSKDEKKTRLLPLLIVLAVGLVLGAMGAGYYYNFGFSFPFVTDILDEGQDNTPAKASLTENPITEERAPELGKAAIVDENTKVEGVEEAAEIIVLDMSQSPSDQQPSTVQEENLIFHLVAGSFTVEQNAHDLHGELMAQGYESVFLGKIGDYYKVSYQSFNNKADANTTLQALKDKGVSSWMIQYALE